MKSSTAIILLLISCLFHVRGYTPHANNTAASPGSDYWHSLHTYCNPRYLKDVLKNHSSYTSDVILAVEREVVDSPSLRDGCVRNATACIKGKHQHARNMFDNDQFMGPATLAMLNYLKSSRFVHFLETLSHISGLLPDPHYRHAGIQQTLFSGFLDIHSDQNRYDKYELHRRVTVEVFLNPQWEDRYGGHLEFWSRNLRTCYAKIRPDLNRMVIFSNNDFSFHGYPQPITCPKHRSRRSLVMHYYTRTRPASDCLDDCKLSAGKGAVFQTPACRSCSDPRCQPPKWDQDGKA